MNESVTGTVAAASVSAFSIATLFPSLQAPVLLGALCGALLLVISQKEIGLPLRIAFFCVAFITGLLTADLFAALVAGYLPQHLTEKVSPGFGALLSSALTVKVLAMGDPPDGQPQPVAEFLKGA
ncbi:putative holin [Edwardsiella ictaluri]|uniref:putative holin n=1 Tax=Edwardsiella ictaluri TaxID=67780 RepID=UPI0039F68BAD